MEKHDQKIRPRLTQFRKFFQGGNLYYICGVAGLLNFLVSFATYGIYNTFGLGGMLTLFILIFCSLFDSFFATFAVASADREGPKIVPAWKKELFVYIAFFTYHVLSPLGRIWVSTILVSTNASEGQIMWGCVTVYCILGSYTIASLFLSYFIQEVTYVVNLVRDTTPSDRDIV